MMCSFCVPVRSFRVQPVALSGSSATSSACSLLGLRLRDGRHQKLVHACLRVVNVLLDEARIDHVVNPVDRQRSFRDVCRYDNLQKYRREMKFTLSITKGLDQANCDGVNNSSIPFSTQAVPARKSSSASHWAAQSTRAE